MRNQFLGDDLISRLTQWKDYQIIFVDEPAENERTKNRMRGVRGHSRTRSIRRWTGPSADGLASANGLATIEKLKNYLSN